ncbi:MAG: hypothetical protein NZM25_10390 [Leptospiraceae bacterium]|nr:hypothetical protein [Leptospiraceae bacterium]MDW8305835.1 hypothetical protein [Leptospiraceae bacterium]
MQSLFKLWKAAYLTKRMNRLLRKFEKEASKKKINQIEYGNLRRGEIWGSWDDDQLIYSFEIDVVAERPFQYRVVYDASRRLFLCYSRLVSKADIAHFLQFTVRNFSLLKIKLINLVNHIPAMRERFLRQYLYNLASEQKGSRFLRFFRSSASKKEALLEFLENLLQEKKISQREYERLRSYAMEL